MLKVKSFSIQDDAGINDLLTNFRLAEGAHILVTDGYVCIPYEDGEAPTKAQLVIETKETINKLGRQIAPMTHSQKVLMDIHTELVAKHDQAEADFKSEPNNKKFEALKKEVWEALTQNESQYRHNEAEIKRIETNITVYQAGL